MPGDKKVLIIDDDEAVVKLLDFRLKTEGYETNIVTDGSRAVSTAYDCGPDIILLDIAMPSETGQDVMEKLQMLDRTTGIPVIIITAYPSQRKSMENFKAIKDFFVKPFDFPRLLSRIAEVLAGEA